MPNTGLSGYSASLKLPSGKQYILAIILAVPQDYHRCLLRSYFGDGILVKCTEYTSDSYTTAIRHRSKAESSPMRQLLNTVRIDDALLHPHLANGIEYPN